MSTRSKNSTSKPLISRFLDDVADSVSNVGSLLRTAKIVASKLEQKEALVWINNELGGYAHFEDGDDLPKYRQLNGVWKAFNPYHGWQPIQFNDPEMELLIQGAPMASSLPVIESGLIGLSAEDGFAFDAGPERNLQIRQSINFESEVRLELQPGQLQHIVDTVRNMLLDWALELDKAGVEGLGMQFTAEERRDATPVTHQIIVQNAAVVGDVSGGATVSNTQIGSNVLSIEHVRDFLEQATKAASLLPEEVNSELQPILAELKTETEKQAPDDGAIRKLLRSARGICEGAAGGIAAEGMISLIRSMLGG